MFKAELEKIEVLVVVFERTRNTKKFRSIIENFKQIKNHHFFTKFIKKSTKTHFFV